MNIYSNVYNEVTLVMTDDFLNRFEPVQRPVIANRPQVQLEEIKAEVTLGVPSKRCAGTGICRLVILGEARPQPTDCRCKQAIAMLSVTDDKRLKFRFLRDSMCKNAARKHFHQQFAIREAVELPAELVERFDLTSRYIARGLYPVLASEEDFTVYF